MSPPPADGQPCCPEQSIVGAAAAVRGGELVGRHREEEEATASQEAQNPSESLKQQISTRTFND